MKYILRKRGAFKWMYVTSIETSLGIPRMSSCIDNAFQFTREQAEAWLETTALTFEMLEV